MNQPQRKSRPSRNPWKVAFLSLITLIIVGTLGLLIAIRLSSNVDQSVDKPYDNGTTPISAGLNKAQLNQLSNYYLNKLQANSQKAKYHFEVADQGIVYGSVKLLGTNVDYSLFFDPKVLSNGNIELHATKMSLGRFPVPISFVLYNVKKAYHLPKWVQLIPNKKLIKLDIVHMNGPQGVNYRAKTINMSGRGQFAFDIILPKEVN